MKNMRQLINLMEGVMPVPQIGGTESDMQTAGTIGRDQADSEFDNAQAPISEQPEMEGIELAGNGDELNSEVDACMTRLQQLSDSFMSEEDAMSLLRKELEDNGYDSDFVADIISGVEAKLAMSELGTEPSALNAPMANAQPGDFSDFDSDDSFGLEEEQFDLNNGYDEVYHADGDDYFPDGADSPVVKTTGPSGARQGDNPEQKKMQVAEVHKELVYGYRNFLSEAAKKTS